MNRHKRAIREIFPLKEANSGLLNVMPSSTSVALATEALDNVNINAVIRDAAISMAREYANQLESIGLRAADYATIPGLAEKLALRIATQLVKIPVEFEVPLKQNIRLRG